MDFFFLLCTTAVMLIRPADYFASSINLYLLVILVCLVASFVSGSLVNKVLDLCSPRSLRRWPVSGCVIGLMGIAVLSDLANLRLDALSGTGMEFAKVVLFFLLLVGLVDSRRRLRILLLATPIFISVTVLLSVLQFLGYVDLPAFYRILIVGDTQVRVYEGLLEDRLIGPGSYQDPNDVCTLINVAVMLSLYGLFSTRPRLLGIAWLAPLGLLLYALHLTQSRGGLLGTMAGIGVLCWGRFGNRRGIIALAVVLPLFFSFFGGRQVELSSTAGTAQQRIGFWAEALRVWKQSPLSMVLGVGTNCLPEYIERPPHNSFLAAYGEMGFLGGTLFLGAFVLGFWQLYRLRPRAGVCLGGPARLPSSRGGQPAGGPQQRPQPDRTLGRTPVPVVPDPELEQMRVFLLGALTSYALNIASTNHTYTVATYVVLGLVAAYIQIAESGPSAAGAGSLVFDGRTVVRLCLVSVGFLILMTVYVRLNVPW